MTVAIWLLTSVSGLIQVYETCYTTKGVEYMYKQISIDKCFK